MTTLLERHNKLYEKVRFLSEADLEAAAVEFDKIFDLLSDDVPTVEQDAEFDAVLEQYNLTRDQFNAWITLKAMEVA